MGSNPPITFSRQDITQLEQWDKNHVWHPFTQMSDYQKETPLIFHRGEGAYLFDVQENRYFDANASTWVNVHGHVRAEINQALINQATTLEHSTLLGPGSVLSAQLAKRLVDITPDNLTRVFYSDNGSTAVEIALKMAFQYWKQTQPGSHKTKYIAFEQAYHGDTLGGVSVGGVDLFHSVFEPLLFKNETVPYPVYSRYTGESAETLAQRSLEKCENIMREQGDQIVALIIEPLVQGAAGMRTHAPGFLKGLRDLCDRYDIFLILDEVFVGFGRTGKMFAFEHEEVAPDLLAIAKGLTAGYMPLSATMATERIFEGFLGEYTDFKTFFHGHSYTGNQLGCAVALANLDLFESDKTIETMQPVVAHLQQKLDTLYETSDYIKDIHHVGFIAGIDLMHSRSKREEAIFTDRIAHKVCLEMRERGIWIRPLGNTIIFVLPLITTIEQVDTLFDVLAESLTVVLG